MNPHYSEWCDGSGISEEIATLNCKPISNKTQIAKLLGWKGYQGPGGWFCQGVDIESGAPTKFGQFKPQEPHKFKGREAKYLSPKTGYDAIALQMPDQLYWHRILEDPTARIVITEGVKKAAALLTCDIPALALVGVDMGLLNKRSNLVSTLAILAVEGRPAVMAFDMDLLTKPEVRHALKWLASRLEAQGCLVSVAMWDEASKGVDDLLVSSGPEAVSLAINNSISYRAWLKSLDQTETRSEKAEVTEGLNGRTVYQTAEDSLYSDGHWIAFSNTLYRWVRTHYQQRPDELEFARIKPFLASLPKHNGEGRSVTFPYGTPANVKNSLEYVKQGLGLTSERVNPPGINCTNGVLELTWHGKELAFKLVPHDPSCHFYLSEPMVKYDPKANSAEYERLMLCLDPGPRESWERTIAASLDLATVRKFKGRAVRAIFLKGDGANGKDTLRTITEMVLGSGTISSCSAIDYKQYDQGRYFPVYSLRGKRINWPSENADVGQIDTLTGLRAAITGDPVTFEAKNKMGVQEPCKAVFLFNTNETPGLAGQMAATKTRWGIVPFTKTFSSNPQPDELPADPRFKEDPSFVKDKILTAFLNVLLRQLQNVVNEGIDYSCTQAAFEELQRESSHLLQFAHDERLQYDPEGSVTVAELWSKLESWYIEVGTLAKDGKKMIWNEQPRRGDKNVKGSNQVLQRFLEIFPKARRGKQRKEGSNTYIPIITGIKFCSKTGQDAQDGQDGEPEANDSQAVQPSCPVDELPKICPRSAQDLPKMTRICVGNWVNKTDKRGWIGKVQKVDGTHADVLWSSDRCPTWEPLNGLIQAKEVAA